MSVWSFQETLTRRLLWWSGASVTLGLVIFAVAPQDFWRGFASQAIGWGLIDALIAFFGARSARKKQAALTPETAEAIATKEAATLRRILLINGGLDVLYIAAALWLIFTGASDLVRGFGWGILPQGLFLLIFDFYHAWKCPKS